MNVFEANCYRDVLRDMLLDKKERFGRAFTFDKMAKACKLQRTYLSAVLSGRGQLNSDQLFAACEFLEMESEQYRFVSLLHERDRSDLKARQVMLNREIETLRAAALRTDSVVDAPSLASVDPTAKSIFYADFTAQMVHMFLTIKSFRKNPDQIRKTLQLDHSLFKAALSKIERAGLIRVSRSEIELLQEQIHLPADSELFPLYRLQMRLKALEHISRGVKPPIMNFSVLFSASEAAQRKIHARFLEFLEWSQKVSQSGEPEEVYQMNFDFLRWS